MPTTIAETVCLKAHENEATVSLNLMNLVQTGEWAISALNGFCTASSDEELCRLLAGGELAYPVAQWLELAHKNAVIAARQNYVKRFRGIGMTQSKLSCRNNSWSFFYDRYFAEREKRRAASLPEGYQNFQMTRMDMGW